MANDEKKTQSLDADILQCKADILKALRANVPAASEDLNLGDDTPEPASKASKPVQQPVTSLKPEIIDTDFEPKAAPKPPVEQPKQAPIRIKPFEATQQPAPTAKPVEAAKLQAKTQPDPAPAKETAQSPVPMVSANELQAAQLQDKLKA
ncbi:MAG: hypothetical protein ACYTET_08435, partial [Planctomycetota bacterium]